jgi:hypothetical protein
LISPVIWLTDPYIQSQEMMIWLSNSLHWPIPHLATRARYTMMICGVQWVWTTNKNKRGEATSKGKGALVQHK